MISGRRELWIGGPNTLLPSPIESLLCWSLALSCLSVSGYHYIVDNYIKPYSLRFMAHVVRRRILTFDRTCGSSSSQPDRLTTTDSLHQFSCWLPLMTYSRAELQRFTPMERFEQLIHLLNLMLTMPTSDRKERSTQGNGTLQATFSDDELVTLLRGNEILRRLASLALRPFDPFSNNETNAPHSQPLGQQLIRIWPRLLALPPVESLNRAKQDYIIGLIIPCYHEQPSDVVQKLKFAFMACHEPQRVQVVLVMAGVQATTDKQKLQSSIREHSPWDTSNTSQWGEVQIVEFFEESGRGPCLNFGAAHAHADVSIFSFCHSDTRLPYHWDAKLIQTLYPETRSSVDVTTLHRKQLPPPRTNSCTFGFGIDKSPIGLQGKPCPPGIRAIEVTANLRCRLWSLPYGDQCLSLRATDFRYLGGFPHQCFMEDYEMIGLLRKRVRLLPEFNKVPNMNHKNSNQGATQSTAMESETLTIISGPPALCSPRRWQKFGVLFVTYTNSKLVNLYANGIYTPDDLYQIYYGQGLAIRAPKSPWEIQLDQLLLLHPVYNE
jgi:hypothetical protein